MSVDTWTEYRITELKRLYTTNSAAEIAAALGGGLTRCAVIGKARRLGLALPVKVKAEPKPRSPRVPKNRSGERHARFKIIAANGNSNKLKLIQSSASEMPKLRCVEIPPLHLSFAQLTDQTCKYPFGDIPADMTFCGNLVRKDSSWCQQHHDICLLPPTPRRDQSRKYFGTDFAKGAA
jgi:GcrA cell cycle regulator